MNLKELSSSRKGQLLLCCGVLVVVWGVLLIRFGAAWLGDLPDKKKIANARKEFEKVSKEYEKVRAEDSEAREVRKRYRNLAAKAWLTSIDGGVETALRRKISEISEKLDFKLSTIGSVRVGRVNPEFSYADIDIQGSGELDDLMRFLAGLAKIQPQLAWRRLDLRPDNRFRRQSGAGSANLAAQLNEVPVTRLNFSGTLRVLVYEGKYSARDLNITREPVQVNSYLSGRISAEKPAAEKKEAVK
ncbi:MAG: hypothetical protein J6W00_04125 [Lentisphaeria bacterium]|nr:hypothetical protein [Lentisphaeria bacterium]